MRHSHSIIALGALLMLCACSQEEEESRAASMPPDQLYREIEAIRELKPKDDPARPLVLQPGDWKAQNGEPRCSFTQPEGVTLLANGREAVLRVQGRAVSLPARGPVDRKAAFFTGGAVSVSVGVLEEDGSEPGASRMAVRLPEAKAPTSLEGKWLCV